MSGRYRSLPRGWQITIAAFEVTAIGLIAFDFTDFAFYWASSQGALSSTQQPLYFAIIPTAAYLGLAGLGYVLARTHKVSPEHFLWFFLALFVVVPGIVAFGLPQAGDAFFDFTVILGLLVGGYLTIVVIGQVRKVSR